MEDKVAKRDEEVLEVEAVEPGDTEVVAEVVVEDEPAFEAPAWADVAKALDLDPELDIPAIRAAVVEFQYGMGRGGMLALGDVDAETAAALFKK